MNVAVNAARTTPIHQRELLLRPLLSQLLLTLLLLLLALTVAVSGVRPSLTRQAEVVRRSLGDGNGDKDGGQRSSDGGDGSGGGGQQPPQQQTTLSVLGRVGEFETELVDEEVKETHAASTDNPPLEVQVTTDITLQYLVQPEPSACQGRRLFIYPNLPPAYHQLLLEACAAIPSRLCPHLARDGLGDELPPLSLDGPNGSGGSGNGSSDALPESAFNPKAWLSTSSETLGVVFHARAQRYDCLVSDWRDADAVYVPVLLGITEWVMADFARVDRIAELLAGFLRGQPAFQRSGGSDHFIVTGTQLWAFARGVPLESGGWGSNTMLMPTFQNVTFASIEAIRWRKNTMSFPYTTGFHPVDADELAHWQRHVAASPRTFPVALVCGTRSNGPAKAIREQLLSQCTAHPDRCHFINCTRFCSQGECVRVKEGCTDSRWVVNMYLSATFCLQPRGDSLTRRSVFDAIGAGCIPVTFSPDTFENQYTWHFPGNKSSYFVSFNQKEVEAGKINVLDELAKIPKEEVAEMRRSVIGVIPNTVYRDHRRTTPTSKSFKDAFDLGLEGIFRKVRDSFEAKK